MRMFSPVPLDFATLRLAELREGQKHVQRQPADRCGRIEVLG
jgi:hypothetical protein